MAVSQITLRDCSKEVREESGYMGVFTGKKQKQNIAQIVEHKRITANHKRQTSQVNNFSAFVYMRKMQESGFIEMIRLIWFLNI